MTTDTVNGRELVLEILLSVTKEETYSHLALASVLDKYQYLSKQERSFITRLTEGTLERMLELDYILNQFSKVKVNKMKPVIRCILRMSVYQFLYMDAIPDSAVCNEAVKLTERKGFRNLKGFVNGVLRNISRNRDGIVYPDETKEPVKAMSVRYSIPEWILIQWQKDYGFEKAKRIAASLMKSGKTTIRVNTLKTDAKRLIQELTSQGILTELVVLPEYPDFQQALYISEYDYLAKIPQFLNGEFYVQDISSMLVSYLAAPKRGDYVIDVCAAPGGKSLHAAELMQGEGMVEARDLTEYKVGLIEENIVKAGLSNIRAVQKDASVLDTDAIEKADVVIADLPCSGLGVMGRKTDIRYKMDAKKEESLSILQRQILENAAKYVKSGGTLMYSTCTINRMENEGNTAWFIENHKEFTLEFERQIFPDEGNGDGFYIAKMIRRIA